MRRSPRAYAKLLMRTATAAPSGSCSALIQAFLELLRAHRALALMPAIMRHVSRMGDRALQTEKVIVTTASPLTAATMRTLKKQGEAMGVELHSHVDPAMKGGAIARARDRRIDMSIESHLRRLQSLLVG